MLSFTQVRPYWLQVVREKDTFEKEIPFSTHR